MHVSDHLYQPIRNTETLNFTFLKSYLYFNLPWLFYQNEDNIELNSWRQKPLKTSKLERECFCVIPMGVRALKASCTILVDYRRITSLTNYTPILLIITICTAFSPCLAINFIRAFKFVVHSHPKWQYPVFF